MPFKLLACEIFRREIVSIVAELPHHIDVEFLPKSLHAAGRNQIQNALAEHIQNVNENHYDALLLAYGLCNGGITGLSTRKIPLVVPKAHDCITLFLGCRKKYQNYFLTHGGTYFLTTGWMEDNPDLNLTKNEVKLFMPHYHRIAFIETGIEPDDSFEKKARKLAIERNWTFDKLVGDLTLLKQLVRGEWDENFLVIEPGNFIQPAYNNEEIIVLGKTP